jgi:hypothetical protein
MPFGAMRGCALAQQVDTTAEQCALNIAEGDYPFDGMQHKLP